MRNELVPQKQQNALINGPVSRIVSYSGVTTAPSNKSEWYCDSNKFYTQLSFAPSNWYHIMDTMLYFLQVAWFTYKAVVYNTCCYKTHLPSI